MKDTSSHDANGIEARVPQAGEAIGERVQSATAAGAAAAGHAQKIVQDATEATVAAVGQTNKALADAAETAKQAWSQAGDVAEEVVDAGRRATRSVSRQIGENPMISVLLGCALGYIAGWWVHGRTAAPDESQTITHAPPHSRRKNKV
jgi:ElaB/YqjD/DUF883 family membrane-anchored ribosome-binding protein